MPEADAAARRARFVELERDLARLRAQHDLAMSAFRFDEANALQRRITALEDEGRQVAAGLLPRASEIAPATGVIPVLARPHRRRRR